MLKPGELIDVVEMSPLTLLDRRTYNLLIANAWDRIDQPVKHTIAKAELRGLHESNDRIGESVERLMTAFVRVYTRVSGKPAIERAQLLGPTTEVRAPDGLLYYSFSDELRAIIKNSNIFARLRRDVIFALKSKYALALYEIIQKRGNLDWKRSEEFELERFRQLIGVEPGRLSQFKHLNLRAIQPAVVEVNGLLRLRLQRRTRSCRPQGRQDQALMVAQKHRRAQNRIPRAAKGKGRTPRSPQGISRHDHSGRTGDSRFQTKIQ